MPRRTLPHAAYGHKAKRRTPGYGKRNTSTAGGVYQREIPYYEAPVIHRGRSAVSTTPVSEKGPFTIQGQRASDLEWRVYKALHALGWTDSNINFQVNILGGRNPGGQVLDFVVYGFGQVYVIPVNGSHWHGIGFVAQETKQLEEMAREAMPNAVFIPLYTADLLSDAQAIARLRREMGRGY